MSCEQEGHVSLGQVSAEHGDFVRICVLITLVMILMDLILFEIFSTPLALFNLCNYLKSGS